MFFTPNNIKDRLRRTPFTPLRILTTTGNAYDVFHPDLVWVGASYVIVGTPSEHDPSIFERENRVALVHICELQDLPPLAKPGSNGPPKATP
jgi:hypothetical protein